LKILFLFTLVILVSVISINDVFAQDISDSQEKTTKTVTTKMDSTLVEVYNSNLSDSGIPSSVNTDSIVDGNKIRVVIEFNTNNYTVPDNLGIEVETTYENMVQALIPIENLEQLANSTDVKFVRMSYQADNDSEIPQADNDSEIPQADNDSELSSENSTHFNSLLFLLVIPIIILIIWKIRKNK
jgi:hypothetical protein